MAGEDSVEDEGVAVFSTWLRSQSYEEGRGGVLCGASAEEGSESVA